MHGLEKVTSFCYKRKRVLLDANENNGKESTCLEFVM